MTKKIFVIDDDKHILEIVQYILSENGYDVKIFTNSQTILKSIQKCEPDIIFLDIRMPGVDGIQICKKIKNFPKTKQIPLVLVSGLEEAATIAKDIGADDILMKPFNIYDLLHLVEKYSKP